MKFDVIYFTAENLALDFDGVKTHKMFSWFRDLLDPLMHYQNETIKII